MIKTSRNLQENVLSKSTIYHLVFTCSKSAMETPTDCVQSCETIAKSCETIALCDYHKEFYLGCCSSPRSTSEQSEVDLGLLQHPRWNALR